jgi:hypothetical protein
MIASELSLVKSPFQTIRAPVGCVKSSMTHRSARLASSMMHRSAGIVEPPVRLVDAPYNLLEPEADDGTTHQ